MLDPMVNHGGYGHTRMSGMDMDPNDMGYDRMDTSNGPPPPQQPQQQSSMQPIHPQQQQQQPGPQQQMSVQQQQSMQGQVGAW